MSQPVHVDVIGAPMGLGGRRVGAKLGPSALRVAEIIGQMRSLGVDIRDLGDVVPPKGDEPVDPGEGIRFFNQVLAELKSVRQKTFDSLSEGHIPLVLGGDHSVAIATISACSEKFDGELGVLWIDAHADLNTPDTSPSLNLHGMPLGLLCGFEDKGASEITRQQWQTLRESMIPRHHLDFNHCFWFGLREVDHGEAARINEHGRSQALTMHDIDRYGVPHLVDRVFDTLAAANVKQVWISFDVDVLDPFIAPGVGTGVRGGLTYREAHIFAEMIAERIWDHRGINLAGVEICEVNPLLDRTNETALIAAEWTVSLFGKRILPSRNA
ncbi:MAG: arginase [Fimbriimonadales bacterium]